MSDDKYRGFRIVDICPPIPSRGFDYHFSPICDDEPSDDGNYPHQEMHGWSSSVNGCKLQIDEILKDLPCCPTCSGRGWIAWSCCGDDISENDYDNCPTCYEHCTTDEGDECEECNGSGKNINK